MPHVRKSEYKPPACEYSLKYVEVIQRHHKRTPYASNTFFKEDVQVSNTAGEAGPVPRRLTLPSGTVPMKARMPTPAPTTLTRPPCRGRRRRAR